MTMALHLQLFGLSAIALLVGLWAHQASAKELWVGNSPFCGGQPRDCPIFDMTYVRSDKYGDGKMCLTGTKVLCRSKDLPHDLTDTPDSQITVASYNVFERPYITTHDGQTERTCHIPRALLSLMPETDVVIFEEAFMGGCWYDDKKVSMRGLMAMYGFPHHTETVGSFLEEAFFIINGGVFIASRWPIAAASRMEFSNAGHADKFSKKGAVYAKVVKRGRTYHVVGTHMQAQIGSSYDELRVKQSRELRSFITRLDIPASEPVLVGGDFNCDLNNNPKNTQDVIVGMGGVMPGIVGDVRATYDYSTNDVVEPGSTLKEWLDYVVHVTGHRAPTSSSLQAFRLTADQDIVYCNSAPVQPYYVWPWASTCSKVKTTRHLSDHFPVVAKFTFN